MFRFFNSVGGVVTRARLMQSRAWAARVSGARGARCAPLTAPVGVLMEVSRTLSTTNELERLAVIARVFPLSLPSHSRRVQFLSLSLCVLSQPVLVTAGALLSSLPALCSHICRCSASALLLLCVSASVLPRRGLISAAPPSRLCSVSDSSLPRLASHSSRAISTIE